VIGDGVCWIWNLAAKHFPGAVEIVGLDHARQHLWELAKKLWPTDERQRLRWAKKWQKRLDSGRIESLERGLGSLPPTGPRARPTTAMRGGLFCP